MNFTKNTNEVVSIHPDLAGLGDGGGDAIQSRFVPGGSIGDLYVRKHKRDAQGRIMIDKNGAPLSTDHELAGNAEPDFSIGWSNNFTFGDKFTAGFVINGKFGGEVYSHTETMLNGFGVSKRSGDARDAGSVSVNAVDEATGAAVSSVDPEKWYVALGDRNGIGEPYVYDRTNIRLTQLSIGYNIDTSSLGIPIESANLSLIGNNLLYTAEAPFDPELSMSTGRNAQGIDNFTTPSTRTIGMNLRLTF